MTANQPRVTLRIRLWIRARVLLAKVQAVTLQDATMALKAIGVLFVTFAACVVGMVAFRVFFTSTLIWGVISALLAIPIAWRLYIATKRTALIVVYVAMRVATPLVKNAETIAFVTMVGITHPMCRVAMGRPWTIIVTAGFVVVALLMRRLTVRKIRFDVWMTPKRIALFVAYPILVCAGWASFVASSEMACDIHQVGVYPIVSVCEARQAKRQLDNGFGPWESWTMLKAGIHKVSEPRDIAFANQEFSEVVATFGDYDERRHQSVVVRMTIDGTVEESLETFSPFSTACDPRSGECIVTSPMMNRMFLMGKTGSVRDVGLGVMSPGYLVPRAGKQLMLLRPDAPPNGVKYRSPAREVEVPEGEFVLATYDFSTGSVTGTPVGGTYKPGVLQGQDMHFVHWSPVCNCLVFGTHLGMVALRDDHFKVRNVRLPLWLSFWSGSQVAGAASDVATQVVYVAFPFAGIGVFDADMNFLRLIPLPNGARPLEFDEGRRLLYVGNYHEGVVHALEVDTGKIKAEWVVGDCVRNIHYYPQADTLLVASGSGFFRINVREALQESGPAKTILASSGPTTPG